MFPDLGRAGELSDPVLQVEDHEGGKLPDVLEPLFRPGALALRDPSLPDHAPYTDREQRDDAGGNRCPGAMAAHELACDIGH